MIFKKHTCSVCGRRRPFIFDGGWLEHSYDVPRGFNNKKIYVHQCKECFNYIAIKTQKNEIIYSLMLYLTMKAMAHGFMSAGYDAIQFTRAISEVGKILKTQAPSLDNFK